MMPDELIEPIESRLEAAQRFKAWIHDYLDRHGVPHHPPGPHGAEGCRIGDRMDWLMARLDAAESALRSLACWLAVGGYNAPTVDAAVFERKIRDGVDTMIRVETERARGPQISDTEETALLRRVNMEFEKEAERLRTELRTHRDKANGDYWAWQGDGQDYPESLVCPVLISADDLRKMLAERDRLAVAIRTHRSQRADDRCIEDDDCLYAALGDGIPCDRRVGDKAAMLRNCERFIDRRCEGGGWPTYAEVEAERDNLRTLNADICERFAAASRALTQAAEKQGEQAREIERLRDRIEDLEWPDSEMET